MNNVQLIYKKLDALRLEVDSSIVDDITLTIDAILASNSLYFDKLDLLEKYTKFLQDNGYIDSDATTEEPFAIDRFMKSQIPAKAAKP